MSIFKCKMCGGTIEFEQGATVGVCDSCGTKQTLPRLDSDKKANLFDRANHFRRNNEFDKAIGIYENILNEDGTDAEAYWSLVLCRYGIEYVEDPSSHKRIPTVNRAQFTSVYMDEDYKSALQYADGYQKQIYEEEAKSIDEIQRGILEISAKEEPFDVFISFKETGADGRRTRDAVLAHELYNELTKEGYKVFFAPVTLEDKLGTAYEPYIFAALNSSKVMVVVGTNPENFNAVWVKNEWSRYLALIKSGAKKTLIPAYRDMDPYDLPEEFSHLMAQDMSKLGFMQDLLRGIRKIISADAHKSTTKETVVVSANNTSTAPLLERVFLFLEDGKWQDADIYCEKVLDIDPKNAEAYLGKLMVELQVKNRKQLADCAEPFDNRDNYSKVLRFGDDKIEAEMHGYIKHINERFNQTVEAVKAAFEKKLSGKSCVSLEDKQANVQSKITELTALSAIFDEKQVELDATEKAKKIIIKEVNSLQIRRYSLGIFAGKEKKDIDRKIEELNSTIKGLKGQSQKLKESLKGYASKALLDAEIVFNQKQLEVLNNQIEEKISASELSFEQAIEALKEEKVKEEFVKRYKKLYTKISIYIANAGDTVFFGTYKQDNNTSNGKEVIKWLVLAKEDNKILVISDKALDCQRYDTSNTDVTWETCSLRKWMNGTFLNNAFSAEEQAQIQNTTVLADENSEYSTNPGNATTDKVFLLSINEVKKYFSTDSVRWCKPTDYAVTNGAYVNSNNGNCWWWLRSPGQYQSYVAGVRDSGSIVPSGLSGTYVIGYVRPAMWISLE